MSSLFKEDDTIILNELNNQIPYTSISTSLEDPFGFSNPSENIETLTGYNRNFFSENRIQLFSIIYRDDLTTVEKQYKRAIKKKSSKTRIDDFRIVKKNEELIYVSAYIFISDGMLILLLSDVTEYYKKQEENNKIINRYKKLMITLNEGIWDWNVKTDKVYYSHRWFEMLDYKDDELKGTFENWKQSVHPDDLEMVMEALSKHIHNEDSIYESVYRLRKKDGTYIWVSDRGIKQNGKDGEVERMIGSHRDITSEKEIRENLEKMIITDEMTGLFNRRYYDSQINDEMLRAERYNSELSILMIDIDLFKQINDTYGHRAGDFTLKELSKVIKNKIRNTDSAYRTGGEEFMVIAPATNIENAKKAAERLRLAASEIKVDTKYGSFSITISLGITTFLKGDTYASFNERADIALYKSKDSGRNRTSVSISN